MIVGKFSGAVQCVMELHEFGKHKTGWLEQWYSWNGAASHISKSFDGM